MNISIESKQKIDEARKRGQKTLKQKALKRRKLYYKNPKRCANCGEAIKFEVRNINYFCSHSCSAIKSNPNRYEKRYCKNCGKQCTGYKNQIYCSRECQYLYKNAEAIEKWLKGEWDGLTPSGKWLSNIIRDYLLKEANYTCEECGWNKINPRTKICPVCVHHKDGNYKNNKKENLQVLCPGCHSLTDTYGGGNRGNGREYRYEKA
jgi:hypothetical protein